MSIGAPGQVTLPDRGADWWIGVRDVPSLFGKSVDFDALRHVKVQLTVGENDTETWEITHQPGSRYWRAESGKAGENRMERLRSLQQALEAEGMSVQFNVVPGTAHSLVPAMELSRMFFEKHLQTSGT